MTDEPTKPVSLRKGAADQHAPAGRPPRTVLYAVGAMVLCGVSALIASIDVYLPSVRDWLTHERRKSIHDDLRNALKDPKADKAKARSDFSDHIKSLAHDVAATQKGVLITTILALVAMGFIGYSAYRGRYWARWGVLGLWFLSSFTSTLIGIQSVLLVTADVPNLYKVPSFVAALLLIGAVIMTNLRPSVEYFAANRPAPADRGGRAARPRRGLFAPPPPRDTTRARASQKKPAATRPAAATDRSRSKQRTNTAAVAKGAELARTRAKAAAKSRRTEG